MFALSVGEGTGVCRSVGRARLWGGRGVLWVQWSDAQVENIPPSRLPHSLPLHSVPTSPPSCSILLLQYVMLQCTFEEVSCKHMDEPLQTSSSRAISPAVVQSLASSIFSSPDVSGIYVISMPRKARTTSECYSCYSPADALRPRNVAQTRNFI